MDILEEINVLRDKLEKAIAKADSLSNEEIIECSKKLDKVIKRYYYELHDVNLVKVANY